MNNQAAGGLAPVANVFPIAKSATKATAWKPHVALRNKRLTTTELDHSTKMFDKLFACLPVELSIELDAFEREFAAKYSQLDNVFESAFFICAQA